MWTYPSVFQKNLNMKRNPIEIFSEWADLDKDFGMEKNHKASVGEMLANVSDNKTPYTFIDAGCGNGWVVRSVVKDNLCKKAMGVDGSKKMIDKAKDTCLTLGFEKGTDKFSDCTLKLYTQEVDNKVALEVAKQKSSSSSSNSGTMIIYDPVRDRQNKNRRQET